MAEILHFEILRKHGQTNTHTHTHTHTNKQTHRWPYGGRGNNFMVIDWLIKAYDGHIGIRKVPLLFGGLRLIDLN